jgi:hypothetical protein
MIATSTTINILSEYPTVSNFQTVADFLIPHIEDSEVTLVPEETYCTGQSADNVIHLLMFRGFKQDYFVRVSSYKTSGQIHTLEICG